MGEGEEGTCGRWEEYVDGVEMLNSVELVV